MSLVNELLKDLEKRESGSALAVGAVPGNFRVGASDCENLTASKRNVYFLVCALFLFSVSSAFFIGNKLSIKDNVVTTFESNMALTDSSENTQQIPLQDILPSGQLSPSDYQLELGANFKASSQIDNLPIVYESKFLKDENKTLEDDSVSIDTQENSVLETIDRLLADAENAFDRDRLTEPFEDNALSRYEAVLKIEADNDMALAGLKAIVNQYLSFQSISINKGNILRASSYLAKAETVAHVHPAIQKWYQSLEKSKVHLTNSAIPARENPIAEREAQSIEQAPQVNQNQATVSVQPSLRTVDSKHSQHADNLTQSNQYQSAIAYLEDVLTRNSELPLSREKLFELYLHNKDKENASLQLNFIQGHKHAYLAARLELVFNQWQTAAVLLEEYSPPIQAVPQYYALLAAVYMHLSRHGDAILVYRKLIEQNQQQSTYWLGLATAYDALGEFSEALTAFRFSRLYGGLDTSTQAYIERRIQQLNNHVLAGKG